MSVEVINIGSGQGIFSALVGNNIREFNDHLKAVSDAQYAQSIAIGDTQYMNNRSLYLDMVKRIDDTTATFIDSSLFSVMSPHSFISITSEDIILKGIPAGMYQSILTYAPVRKLLNKDEIYGFGIHPKDLPIDDPYDRLINNCVIDNQSDGIGYEVFHNDIPNEIEGIDLMHIDNTRKFIMGLIKKGIDPTDYPNKIGKIL